MAKRYNRRSVTPLADLPSLFDDLPTTKAGRKAEPRSFEPKVELPVAPPRTLDDFKLADVYATAPHRLRFMSLGSGSSGNCTYVGTPECGLLIDAGVDNNFVNSELARNGIDISTIRGILLTHDHGDHVRYAYALVRRNPRMKVYATPRTLDGLLRRHSISRRIKDYHSAIYKEHEYQFDDIQVIPFETSHDGTDNVGYHISMGGMSVVIATDMGVVTERADHYIRRANALMIEANYDSAMLEHGHYPEYLKARIRGARGHMDNAHTAEYLARIWTPQLRYVFLCHLSDDNNDPETAVAAVRNALQGVGVKISIPGHPVPAGSVNLSALPRFKSSELFMLPVQPEK